MTTLPTRQRKPSIWHAMKALRVPAIKSETASHNTAFDPWNESGIKKFNSMGNVNQPIVRRSRAFTGRLVMSAQSFPSRFRLKQKLLRLGVGLFLVVDVALIGLFLKSFF